MADGSTMGERITRIETRLDGIAEHVDAGRVKQELRSLSHRIDVPLEHVDEGFRRAELMHAMDQKHDRRAADYEVRHYQEMDLLRAVLGDHGARIRRLEHSPNRPS